MSINLLDVGKNIAGQIVSFKDWLDQSSAGYLIKPYTARGIGGFVFSISDDDRVELRAEVTDYVVEDNSTKQDHIALKPVQLTLRGFVGELENIVDNSPNGVVGVLAQRLTAVSNYLPLFSPGALQAQSKALAAGQTSIIDSLDAYVKKTQNLATSLGVTLPGQTKQEQAFSNLFSMWASRQVMTVETPWKYFDNMVITSVVAEQDGKTRQISDISVSLKQMRFAGTIFEAASAATFTSQMLAPFINKSQNKGVTLGLTQISSIPMKSAGQKNAFKWTAEPNSFTIGVS